MSEERSEAAEAARERADRAAEAEEAAASGLASFHHRRSAALSLPPVRSAIALSSPRETCTAPTHRRARRNAPPIEGANCASGAISASSPLF